MIEKLDKELTVPKLVLISLAQNTPNAQEFICPICKPKPKSSEFQWKKAALGAPSPCYLRLKKQQASLIRSLLKYGIGKGF